MNMSSLEEHEFIYQVRGQDLETFYLAAGPINGPLTVFVHGWPAIAKTWKHQLTTFTGLGFRVVAPDMIGYGRSSSPKEKEAYSLENVNLSMVALLEHLGREEAIWVGHDWGCGAVWSFAEHYPSKCIGVCGMAVPARVLELGLTELLEYVNRSVYPIDKYPNGQWDYQVYYETDFEKATAWFDQDPAAFLRLMYSKGKPENFGKPSLSHSTVVKGGGRFGGIEKPDAEWKKIPVEDIVLDEDLFGEVVEAMEKTGFWGGNCWYANHERNRRYFEEKATDDGYLRMPVLFIEAKFDAVCDTATSRLAEPQRKYCTNLTETSIDAGHWVAQEKPEEVNAALVRWLLESCPQHFPGYWSNPFVRSARA